MSLTIPHKKSSDRIPIRKEEFKNPKPAIRRKKEDETLSQIYSGEPASSLPYSPDQGKKILSFWQSSLNQEESVCSNLYANVMMPCFQEELELPDSQDESFEENDLEEEEEKNLPIQNDFSEDSNQSPLESSQEDNSIIPLEYAQPNYLLPAYDEFPTADIPNINNFDVLDQFDIPNDYVEPSGFSILKEISNSNDDYLSYICYDDYAQTPEPKPQEKPLRDSQEEFRTISFDWDSITIQEITEAIAKSPVFAFSTGSNINSPVHGSDSSNTNSPKETLPAKPAEPPKNPKKDKKLPKKSPKNPKKNSTKTRKVTCSICGIDSHYRKSCIYFDKMIDESQLSSPTHIALKYNSEENIDIYYRVRFISGEKIGTMIWARDKLFSNFDEYKIQYEGTFSCFNDTKRALKYSAKRNLPHLAMCQVDGKPMDMTERKLFEPIELALKIGEYRILNDSWTCSDEEIIKIINQKN